MNMLILVWRNSFRKKVRFWLTCISVMVAFFLFTTLSGVNHALTENVSSSNQYRLMTSHKESLTQSLPINDTQKIAALLGVKQVSYASWFGGFYQDEKNQLPVIAVDHDTYFDLFVLPEKGSRVSGSKRNPTRATSATEGAKILNGTPRAAKNEFLF